MGVLFSCWLTAALKLPAYQRSMTCSTWTSTSTEIDKSTQILVNNGFTNKDVALQTRKVIDRWYAGNFNATVSQQENKTPIRLFYKNQYHRDYKKDERALRNIIGNHVKPTSDNEEIKLIIYYKGKRTSSLIMKNNPSPRQDMIRRRNVVYQFKCPVMGCSQDYIGMTTMRLSKRISCHLQEGAIHRHLERTHNTRLSRENLIATIQVIDQESDPKRLRYLEALHILEKKPAINCTDEPLLLPSLLPSPTGQQRPAM